MPAVAELEVAFALYFSEMERCTNANCYWALVHLVVVLPDVCAALESTDGESTGSRYQDWCSRHLPPVPLSPLDRWEMRCDILHQGRATASKGQYRTFSFLRHAVDPSPHQRVTRKTSGNNIALDPAQMAREVTGAVRHWFAELQKPQNAAVRQNVARHLRLVVRVKPKRLPGVPLFDVQSST